MRRLGWMCALVLLTLQMATAQAGKSAKPKSGNAEEGQAGNRHGSGGDEEKAPKTAYSFELPGPEGKGIPLSQFKGKVLLLVNLARNSSYNDQLPALIKLGERFKDNGLVIVGIPSNDFGLAEPGTDAEIQKVYKTDDKVPFLVTERAELLGEQALPLYGYLTKGKDAPAGGDVHWNYTKFLIDKSGKVVKRLDPDVTPDSPEMLSTIEEVLGGGSGRQRRQSDKPATPSNKPNPNNRT